jgi:hypothetical protein
MRDAVRAEVDDRRSPDTDRHRRKMKAIIVP